MVAEEQQMMQQGAQGAPMPQGVDAQGAPQQSTTGDMEQQSTGGIATAVQGAASGDMGQLPPKLRKEIQGYKTILTKMVHGKQIRGQVLEMLKSGPAEIVVPSVSLTLDRQASAMMEQQGMPAISQDAKLACAIFLVSDLIDLGNAAEVWEEPVSEEEAPLIFQDTLQDYIQQGLKDGTIDPIELQQQTEPLLSEEQRQVGQQIAQKEGLPMEATPEMISGNQRQMSALGAAGQQGGQM